MGMKVENLQCAEARLGQNNCLQLEEDAGCGMMYELRTIHIGDLGRVLTGKTPPSVRPELFGDDHPFLTPTDIDGASRYIEPERFLSPEGRNYQQRLMLPGRSVCVVCIGATIGKVCMTGRPSFTNQQINSVVVNEQEHDPFFVYHLMTTLRDELKANAGGSATPIINKTAFSEIKVRVPPLPVQRRIAGILSTYDELIENSQRRIKILEEMARSVYREWFVHFRFPGHENVSLVSSSLGAIPQGWEAGRLDDVLVLQRGFDLPKAKRMEGTVPIYAATGVTGFHCEAKVKAPCVVTGRSGTIGDVIYVQEDFWPLNTSLWAKGFPKSEPLYAYYVLSSVGLKQFNSGAAVPTLNRNDLHGLDVLIPPCVLQKRFQKIAGAMLLQTRNLELQIQNLRRTRDLLLPRLLSGQVNPKEN
ncbi:restriction endonuclease subunit S [Chlorobium phaeobacteroides]|nr:restriction endonuclease subunit S [Chlorobium phaeobacteroides]